MSLSEGRTACSDVVIVGAYRSPMCKAKRGGLRDMGIEGMLSQVLEGTLKRTGVSPEAIEEVVLGNALSKGYASALGRMACLRAGIPVSSTLLVINRQCASGLEAVSLIADKIRRGDIEIGIGAGVESMSRDYPCEVEGADERVLESEGARDCLLSMGATSENVGEMFGVSREDQDVFASESQRKAAEARTRGVFREEIIPIRTGEGVVEEDEGIRASTAEGLSRLRPAFKADGRSTAGNSSQLSDGAAAVVLMSRRRAEELSLRVLGVFHRYVTVGVDPKIMGVGPIYAIPKLFRSTGESVASVDLFEINEAFASQALASVRVLGIPKTKVNVNGGAIALGHPLGCTGARLVVSLLSALREGEGRKGVVSMCVGSGFGAAALISRE